jgi:hypothetical protein
VKLHKSALDWVSPVACTEALVRGSPGPTLLCVLQHAQLVFVSSGLENASLSALLLILLCLVDSRVICAELGMHVDAAGGAG